MLCMNINFLKFNIYLWQASLNHNRLWHILTSYLIDKQMMLFIDVYLILIITIQMPI